MATNQLPQMNRNQELLLDAQDYWSQLRGSPEPPTPSYRQVKGLFGTRRRLGRYMDPYGCTGLMEDQKNGWVKWCISFLIIVGTGIVFSGVELIFLILLLPLYATWYLAVRARYRRRYDFYWSVIQEIERTGQPQWVPYDKDRLKLIDRRPNAVWP